MMPKASRRAAPREKSQKAQLVHHHCRGFALDHIWSRKFANKIEEVGIPVVAQYQLAAPHDTAGLAQAQLCEIEEDIL